MVLLNAGGNPYTPWDYTEFTGNPATISFGCPGNAVVCAICVPPCEIYDSSIPTKECLPKVDVTTTHIHSLIDGGDEVYEDDPSPGHPDYAVERHTAQ